MKAEPSEPSSLYQCFTSGEPLWTYLPLLLLASHHCSRKCLLPPASSEPLSIPTYLTSPWYGAVSSLTPLYRKARIFVSYHHRLDQWYYDSLSRFVSVDYEVLYDNSPERRQRRRRVHHQKSTGKSHLRNVMYDRSLRSRDSLAKVC